MQGILFKQIVERGFGFVRGDDGQSYFLHWSAMAVGRFDELHEGDRLIFEPTQTPKGPRAEQASRA